MVEMVFTTSYNFSKLLRVVCVENLFHLESTMQSEEPENDSSVFKVQPRRSVGRFNSLHGVTFLPTETADMVVRALHFLQPCDCNSHGQVTVNNLEY